MQKKKILMISDHALSTSGVGTQSRYLTQGLLKTGRYQFRQLGAAIKHSSYDTIAVPSEKGEWGPQDWIIKPINGFGDQNLIRFLLATERPDAILLFTDPRFFNHVLQMEDEIHQVCPIAWWHVWDNDPYPTYNDYVYQSCDLFNCHSYKTYSMVHERHPEKTHFAPHAVPDNVFFPITETERLSAKVALLGKERKDWFTGFWVNRNARRKMPNDVLDAWAIFLAELEAKHGHRDAVLVMHTDPNDQEGPNLVKVVEHFGLNRNVAFSTDRIEFSQMNVLHNISDFCVNISSNEGFGLGTLEAMMTGRPIVALKTGGLTRQVVDHRDGSENGIALEPDVRNLVGSQMVPYIYEDHVNNHKVAAAFLRMYEMGAEKRFELGQKALSYARSEFSLDETVRKWDETLWETIHNWKARRNRWQCIKL